jgi:glycogen debranching enzyme
MRQAYPEVRLRIRERMAIVSRGDTVLVTGRDGAIDGEPEYGLYVHQTRLLNRYRMRLGGVTPLLAAASNSRQDRWEGYFIVAPPEDGKTHWRTDPQAASQDSLELRVGRIVGEGLHEDIDITNYARRSVSVSLVLEVDSDFADPEETKGERQQQGSIERSWTRENDDAWVLCHDYRASRRVQRKGERGTLSIQRTVRMRIVHATSPPVRRGGRISFEVTLAPREQWHACIEWHAQCDGKQLPVPECPLRSGYAENDRTEAPFLNEATQFETAESQSSATSVMETLEQARHDINALRLYRMDLGEREWTVAAGVPMYVGFFGRDTMLAACQAAIAGPELLRGTLPHLARLQGRHIDDWRDEQPGRILHEAHEGPIAALQLHPKGRYYGSLSSSGLFPFCVAQLWNWTADRNAVAPLIEPSLRALDWLDRHGREHRGMFYAYKTRSRQGLENQGWKDSGDAIVDEDGHTVEQPAATCEEQGTVFAAKVAFAEVLWAFGRKREARRVHREAMELRKQFNDAYWIDDLGFFAMALAPDGRKVRSIGSNALHSLSTGIAGDACVPQVVERLFARDMFSGWGIRTLSSDHPAYNPYAYHRGSVWPVEHGPFAIGAFRAGFHDRVQQLARAMFDAASIFDSHRLPECFSGHPRDAAHPFPSLYPPSNSLQAWSATTPFALVQAMLGLQPYAPEGVLLVDPHLPEWLPTICLRGLRIGDAMVDLEFRRQPDGSTAFDVCQQSGPLRIERRATSWAMATSFGDALKQLLAA